MARATTSSQAYPGPGVPARAVSSFQLLHNLLRSGWFFLPRGLPGLGLGPCRDPPALGEVSRLDWGCLQGPGSAQVQHCLALFNTKEKLVYFVVILG